LLKFGLYVAAVLIIFEMWVGLKRYTPSP